MLLCTCIQAYIFCSKKFNVKRSGHGFLARATRVSDYARSSYHADLIQVPFLGRVDAKRKDDQSHHFIVYTVSCSCY